MESNPAQPSEMYRPHLPRQLPRRADLWLPDTFFHIRIPTLRNLPTHAAPVVEEDGEADLVTLGLFRRISRSKLCRDAHAEIVRCAALEDIARNLFLYMACVHLCVQASWSRSNPPRPSLTPHPVSAAAPVPSAIRR
jgi:hypothetical protein